MHYTPQTYEMAVAANAHTGLKKPSFKEREKLIAQYKANSMTKVEKVTAVMVKEVMDDA
ncbi:hypothetical protein [Domibacillus enclensis]|uniref:Uncharacterized protein n=1 Tax=Domibacillus enclensis TaxID=1017273 RepID=A0A1N6WG90_9BACI|nr:hypothetical protein [Domibacillus enclensis]SIQ89139.1 hypothetical protein SAMN05443094_104157 [Domibacillus enclensis]